MVSCALHLKLSHSSSTRTNFPSIDTPHNVVVVVESNFSPVVKFEFSPLLLLFVIAFMSFCYYSHLQH